MTGRFMVCSEVFIQKGSQVSENMVAYCCQKDASSIFKALFSKAKPHRLPSLTFQPSCFEEFVFTNIICQSFFNIPHTTHQNLKKLTHIFVKVKYLGAFTQYNLQEKSRHTGQIYRAVHSHHSAAW